MTPPNELEQLAEFQDAIQSNEGLERLRAMQYLQQMNNQGLMGMPQVTTTTTTCCTETRAR